MATQAKRRATQLPGGEGAAARVEARSQQHHQQAGPLVSDALAACIEPVGEDAEYPNDEQRDSEVQLAVPERLVPGSRGGAMYSGAFGRTRDLRHKMMQEQQGLIRSNPIAFQEDMASQADAKYRCLIAVMRGGAYISLSGLRGDLHKPRPICILSFAVAPEKLPLLPAGPWLNALTSDSMLLLCP